MSCPPPAGTWGTRALLKSSRSPGRSCARVTLRSGQRGTPPRGTSSDRTCLLGSRAGTPSRPSFPSCGRRRACVFVWAMTPDTGWPRGSWLASGPLHSTPLAREMVLPEEAEAERSVSAAGRTQQAVSLGFEPGSVDFDARPGPPPCPQVSPSFSQGAIFISDARHGTRWTRTLGRGRTPLCRPHDDDSPISYPMMRKRWKMTWCDVRDLWGTG